MITGRSFISPKNAEPSPPFGPGPPSPVGPVFPVRFPAGFPPRQPIELLPLPKVLLEIDPHSPAGYLSSLHPFRCTPHSGRETPPTPAGLHLGRGETLPGPLPGQSQSLQPIERPSHTKRQGEHRKNQWDQSLAAPLPVGITAARWAGRSGPNRSGVIPCSSPLSNSSVTPFAYQS